MGRIDELIEAEYGGQFTYQVDPLVTELQTTRTVFLHANADRVAFLLFNLDPDSAFIAPSPRDASTTEGVQVPGNGGWRFFNWKDDLILPSLEWNGLTSGAAAGAIWVVTLEGSGSRLE